MTNDEFQNFLLRIDGNHVYSSQDRKEVLRVILNHYLNKEVDLIGLIDRLDKFMDKQQRNVIKDNRPGQTSLEKRVEALEKHSHPPVDLTPAIISILNSLGVIRSV